MAIVRNILIGFVVLIALFLAGGFLIPAEQHVERDIVIGASSQAVYDVVRDFDQFNDWSPWSELDPEARYELTGTAGEVGSALAWFSDKPDVGNGRQTIAALTPYSQVDVSLEFDGQPPAMTRFSLSEQANGTRVIWSMDTDFGNNPLFRYFGLVLDDMVGKDYEKGLAQLKRYVEDGAAGEPG